MKLTILEAAIIAFSMCGFALVTYAQLPEHAPQWKLIGCQVGVGVFFSMFLMLVLKRVWERVWEEEE